VRKQKRWADLSGTQRVLVVVGAALEMILTSVALRDLARRPAGEVRGAKVWWALGCSVQPVGPIAYLAFGRRRP
jgi:hypothetical protein